MPKPKRTLLLLVAVDLLLSSLGRADVVHTTDGSRLVGTIERMSDGKLVIVTDIAGRLELDATKVSAIATDQKVNVEFETGDRLVGTIDVSDDQSRSIVHTALGDVEVESSRMTSAWPEGTDSPEVVAIKAEVERTRLAMTPKWSATLEAGASRSEGNTDTLKARGRFDVRRKTDKDLLHLYLAAKYSEENKVRSENEYRGGVRFEAFVSKKSFWYTRSELEFDEFENLDLRATAAVGAGHYWIRRDDHELKTNAGLGYRHESFKDGRTENDAVLDLGLGYRVDIAPWAQFTHNTTYTPDFQDTGNYRLDLDTALLIPLKSDQLKLKLGMTNEYNSQPDPGRDRLDNTYYANILWELVDQ